MVESKVENNAAQASNEEPPKSQETRRAERYSYSLGKYLVCPAETQGGCWRAAD